MRRDAVTGDAMRPSRALMDAIRAVGPPPIPHCDAALTTLATFWVMDALRCGREVPIDWTSGWAASEPRYS
jgi:hypothetical protein